MLIFKGHPFVNYTDDVLGKTVAEILNEVRGKTYEDIVKLHDSVMEYASLNFDALVESSLDSKHCGMLNEVRRNGMIGLPEARLVAALTEWIEGLNDDGRKKASVEPNLLKRELNMLGVSSDCWYMCTQRKNNHVAEEDCT